MKLITLTQGKFAMVDDSDYEWLNQLKWFTAQYRRYCYAVRRNGKEGGHLKMHRLILGITNPKIFVDHKDHNGLNNQRSNLRIANHSQNASNISAHKNSSSKYLGVCWHKRDGVWTAAIFKNKKIKHLGYFESEKAAAIAYNNAAKEIHGEFANLNKIK